MNWESMSFADQRLPQKKDAHQANYEALANTCLSAISACLEWLPLESILEEGIVFKVFSLLVHESKPIRMVCACERVTGILTV